MCSQRSALVARQIVEAEAAEYGRADSLHPEAQHCPTATEQRFSSDN